MLCKWENFWSEPFADVKRLGGFALGAAIALSSLSISARAAVTATVSIGGNQVPPSGPASTTFYFAGAIAPTANGVRGAPVLQGCPPAGVYPVPSPSASPAPTGTLSNCVTYVDNGYTIYDFGQSAGTDGSLANQLQFQLTSSGLTSTSATTTQTYVVVPRVYLTQGINTTIQFAPVASVNGASCAGGGCYTLGSGNNYPGGTGAQTQVNYAAPFTPGQTVTIGIYPADICWSAQNTNPTGATGTPLGCASNSASVTGYSIMPVTAGLAAPASVMQIEFDILPIAAGASANTAFTSVPASADTPTVYTLNFQADTPTLVAADNCSLMANETSANPFYTPGDSQIFVNTGALGLDIVNNLGNAQAIDPSHAPATGVLVAGVKGPDGTGYPTIDRNNPAAEIGGLASPFNPERLQIAGTQPLTGFANTTGQGNTDPNTYQLVFMVRDATGMVAVAPPGSCVLKDVQTSEIQGFLSQSQCFIATGAFRSATAGPVLLLRLFRDQVLLHSRLGKAFVHWYYGWSPPAAEWLIDHPVFRFPVLLALAPLEAAAWLALHPLLLLLALAVAAALLALGIFSRVVRAEAGAEAPVTAQTPAQLEGERRR